MAVLMVYDSGTSDFLSPDIWQSYRRSADPVTSPLFITLQILPVTNPPATWNLYGYAMVEAIRQSQAILLSQTPISSARDSTGVTTLLDVEALIGGGSRVSGFRGVWWNVNRWIGPYRAIVRTID